MSTTTGHDTYTLEIIKSALTAIGDEMFAALRRTSMSPIIYEALDYSVGVTDRNGDLIAQGNGTTVFLGMIDSLVRDILSKFGPDNDIHPGDVFISNDPYEGGGTHLSDVALAKPVFFADQLVGFTVNKAHWVDVGGMWPGSYTTDSTEIFQEGLQLPTIKIIAGGEPVRALIEILESNIRMPEASMGDFWAGIAANNVGETRLVSLFEKYGRDAVFAAMDELLDYGERMIAAELKKLPKGEFCAEDWIDDDGISADPLKVCVKITITDEKFSVDFSGSAPQAIGPINNSRTGLISAVRTIFKALTNPQIPANGGCFRALEVICPDHTVFTAKRPAPTSTYWETMLYAEDLIWKAMARHVPERLTAGHVLSVCAVILASRHPHTGESTILVGPLIGGWGAMHNRDGLNGQFSVADGETYNIPVEIIEARYGVTVEQYAFHNEDGGEGRYRGGKGICFDVRLHAEEASFTGSFGRFKYPPWGVDGGRDGSRNYFEVLRGGVQAEEGEREVYGKAAQLKIRKGDVLRWVTATGGGWGDPRKRSDEALARDLKNGFVTEDQIRRYYRPDADAE
jgi:N-methylhydantoinase B